MSNSLVYKKIISDAKDYYESNPFEIRNIKNGSGIFDLIWCKDLSEEINLWTYWQGAGVEHPDVMIVGQDFGTCSDVENKSFYYRCTHSSIKDRENISKEYIGRILKNKNNKTDNMLITLTEEGLGKSFSSGIPCNEHLFFTNLCLGYRSCGGISGGDMSAYLKHDSIYIARLISIKRPSVVICLGQDTYLSLVNAFVEEKTDIKDICENFWHNLNEGENFKDISCDDFSFRMYGVSHAGSNGAMNRKKNCTLNEKEKYTGNELMLMDWKTIGNYLSENNFNTSI